MWLQGRWPQQQQQQQQQRPPPSSKKSSAPSSSSAPPQQEQQRPQQQQQRPQQQEQQRQHATDFTLFTHFTISDSPRVARCSNFPRFCVHAFIRPGTASASAHRTIVATSHQPPRLLGGHQIPPLPLDSWPQKRTHHRTRHINTQFGTGGRSQAAQKAANRCPNVAVVKPAIHTA
ncbi:unnamed protein product [Parajaminaea phylloscopi]